MKRLIGYLVLLAAAALLFGSMLPASGGPRIDDGGPTAEVLKFGTFPATLQPLDSGFKPAITSEDAVKTAQSYHTDATGSDVSFTPILGAYTNQQILQGGEPLIENVPAWVVTINGLCEDAVGGGVRVYEDDVSSAVPRCAITTRNVVISAATGELIEDFSANI